MALESSLWELNQLNSPIRDQFRLQIRPDYRERGVSLKEMQHTKPP